MNRSDFLKRIPALLFYLTLISFLFFFIIIANEEKASVYHSEPPVGYGVISETEMELSSDASAPAGVLKIYRFTLPSDLSQEDYLCFNISHNNIEVYFENDLAYSLKASENNRIAKNVSNNWCIVHAGQNNIGKDVTVILTPLFEEAISKNPEFLLGAPYAIATELIVDELPLLVISALCFLLGILVVAVFLYFRFIIKIDNKEIIYLGFFSMSIGLWKLTDLRCISLLMPEHALSLGYISVGALFMTSICLLPYFSTLFVKGKKKILTFMSCGSFVVCLIVLLLQLLGITEIRQNLIYCHILLIVALIAIPVTVIVNRIVYKTSGLKKSWRLLLLLLVGITLDLVFYYRNDRNGLLSFSIMSLIIYTLIIFLMSVKDSVRKSYTDSGTGLINRTRWMELITKEPEDTAPYAMMMIDMNGLKQVNDSLGHDAGDQMIFQLSSILRKTLPRTSVICRWGGDEFAVMLTDTDRAHLNLQISELFLEGEKYNAEHPELPIHFAIGAALSSEHPELSGNDLFRLADEEMYINKKAWYEKLS